MGNGNAWEECLRPEEAGELGRSEQVPLAPLILKAKTQDRIAAAMLVAAVAACIWPLWSVGDSPPGIDIFGHLFKPWYLIEILKTEGFVPQWMNAWYNGFHLLQYYPPLSYLIIATITILTGNVFTAYVVFVGLALAAAGLAAFQLSRIWLPTWGAWIAALAYVFAPYNMMVVFWEGNLPRTLAMVFIPVVVYGTVRLIEAPTWQKGMMTAGALCALVLSHHMPALVTLILLVPFVLVYVSLKRLPFTHLLYAGLWLAAGLMLSSIWLVPAVTHLDLSRVPNLNSLPERVGQYSAGLDLVDPRYRLERNAYLSLAVLGIAAFGFIRSREKALRWAALASVLTGIFFALGKNNPLFEWLPFLQYWFPERFLQGVILFAAILAGGAITSIRAGWKRLAAGLIIIVILAVDFLPNFALREVSAEEEGKRAAVTRLSTWLATQENPGRLLVQAPIDWETAFTVFSLGGKEQNYGWSPEGSAVSLSATEINTSLREGNTIYPRRLFGLWDTRFVVLDPLIADQDALAEDLLADGWHEAVVDTPWRVLAADIPSQRYFIQDRTDLVIGRGAAIAARLFPGLAQGTSAYVDDYSFEYLRQFEDILLYDFQFRDQEKMEALLTGLINAGVRVLVDMQFQENMNLFNVQAAFSEIEGEARAFLTAEEGEGIPLEAIGQESSYRGFYPLNYDAETILELRVEGSLQSLPLIVAVPAGEGEAIFIGMSLTTLATTFHDPSAVDLIGGLLGQSSGDLSTPTPLEVEKVAWRAQSLHFSAAVEGETPIVISMTYTPHWRADVDGFQVPIFNHEDLCMLWLPAGEHMVELTYGISPGQIIGLGIAMAGIALAAAMRWLHPGRLKRWLDWAQSHIFDW